MIGADVERPLREIRAEFDATTLTVYQAYSSEIADAALRAGTLVFPFELTRMTWIKPSFLWMMYRSGWASKPGQERILAFRISRAGFEQAIANACLTHYDAEVYSSRDEWMRCMQSSPVRVQWDPERAIDMSPLPWRTIQVGLSGAASLQYVSEWIQGIVDVTVTAHDVRRRQLNTASTEVVAVEGLPIERPYPLPPAAARAIGSATATI